MKTKKITTKHCALCRDKVLRFGLCFKHFRQHIRRVRNSLVYKKPEEQVERKSFGEFTMPETIVRSIEITILKNRPVRNHADFRGAKKKIIHEKTSLAMPESSLNSLLKNKYD